MNATIINKRISEPSYFHHEYSNDFPELKEDQAPKTWLDNAQRLGLVALPFIALYKPLSLPLSIATGGLRVFSCGSQLTVIIRQGDAQEVASQLLQTAIAVIALAGTIFAHPLGMLITTTHDILIELYHLLDNLKQGEYEKAVLNCANIVNNVLYFALFVNGGIEIAAASLAMQVIIGAYHAREEFNKGQDHYLEAAGHLLMTIIRANQLRVQLEKTHFNTNLKIMALKVASYLTEPACKVREYFYSFYILDQTCQTTAQKTMRIGFLTLGITIYALWTPFTAPLGIVLRGVVAAVESKPMIYLENSKVGKILPEDKKITLVSHNECYMPAGYSITDGQVTPPSDKERVDANIREIKKLNPDIVCLYEVADICDASYLTSQLPEYPFIIPVAGVRAIGPSSMMYVASKYEIVENSIEFTPFIKGVEITGRAQFSEKGILSFDLRNHGDQNSFATVFSTHLQHSEIPANPKDTDQISRAAQMDKMIGQIQKKVEQNKNIIFTGDLNQSEDELYTFLHEREIDWLRRDEQIRGQQTWDGDEWCANLMNKEASGPQVLDYTFIAGKTAAISTQILGTGYCSQEFRSEARSDHDLLFSTITVA
ncbi:MAG TPA: endonuclease/exonuclease/phosphatase family protein [Rhabdochlamydiaceae bacterium]|nr:endonuclease/exonuclease/phosphatase family protein [Rhabdochlamydiaceae bacterium]